MGKTTGFIDYARVEEARAPVQERLKNHKEFVITLAADQAQQQSARCMDCGIPFCSNGCPVNNIIPDFNDLIYQGDWRRAIDVLHATNNFPEFTGRICPAPCETACTLTINSDPVGIKSIEHAIIEHAWAQGWVQAQPPTQRTSSHVAVVGSGPAGLAAAQQLARAGHAVTVFEKNDRIGGLLRYGIPDFKMEKSHIDRRVAQMEAEGVIFRTGVLIGTWPAHSQMTNESQTQMSPEALTSQFDAVLLAVGAEQSRDLPVPGRDLQGVHFAMEFLPQQNKINAGDTLKTQVQAQGKHVVVIGGGDTGSDCVGTSNRQGALSVTQLELLPIPPEQENTPLVWPYWPIKLRTSSSHEEGCERQFAIATKAFLPGKGPEQHQVKAIKTVQVQWQNGQMSEVPGTEEIIEADLVFLAMGFVSPMASVLDALGVAKDPRGHAKATTEGPGCYATNIPRVFVAGDMRRGQSLVVWAIREGRQAARAIDEFLRKGSPLTH